MSVLLAGTKVAHVSLFGGLSGQEIAAIYALARPMEYPAGAEVVSEGEDGGTFHLIISGEAHRVIGGQVQATLEAGDHFGAVSLLDGGPRTASIVATTPMMKTCAISRLDFARLLEQNASIARKLLSTLAALVRELRAGESQGYSGRETPTPSG